MSSFGVLLDANVLYPAVLRDTLFRAAQAGLFRMILTDEILEEVRRNLVKNGECAEDRAERLISTIKWVFERNMIEQEYADIIPVMTNHEGDRHVLAAAVVCRAEVIVTFNLRHFPKEALAPYQIEAMHPDAFLCDLLETNISVMQKVLFEQAQALHNPPKQ
jgi:predicted nucleic acid-binding protein